jgi:hypothetical protein
MRHLIPAIHGANDAEVVGTRRGPRPIRGSWESLGNDSGALPMGIKCRFFRAAMF